MTRGILVPWLGIELVTTAVEAWISALDCQGSLTPPGMDVSRSELCILCHLSQWPLPMAVLASLTSVPPGCGGTCSSLRMADAGSVCTGSLCLYGLCRIPKCRENEGRRGRGGLAKKERGSRVTLSLKGLQSPDLWGACTVNTQVSCVVTCRGGGMSGWGWDKDRTGIEAAPGWL